ncbi:MAG: Gfo/Idh/MocA family oxidoreductase [Planctomycetota bacterium]|nr:Gfo/Idh/MocA family oxidoreductase [Planctomycetota bacterium]
MNCDINERRTILRGITALGGMQTWQTHCRGLDAPAKHAPIDVVFITEPTASHRRSYLRILAKCDGVRRIAVVDPTGKTVEESQRLLGNRFAYAGKDAKHVLTDLRPALTVITLETHHAPAAIEEALRLWSHVLTEKPACVERAQLDRIVDVADKHHRQLMLAMSTRSSPLIKRARSLIQDDFLGKPYAATMDWVADQTRLQSPDYQASWLSFKNRAGGGKLIFHGIHYLDVISFLVDQPIRHISAMCANVGGQPIEVEDAAIVNFQTRQGMLGTLNTGYYLARGKQNQIRIWGARGWLELQMLPERHMLWSSSHPDAPQGVQEVTCPATPSLYESFFRDTIAFARGLGEPPITTAESAHALDAVFSAYQAAANGQTQTLASSNPPSRRER